MPTVHLSLPEKVYRELKRYADYMGVQITDLIKFMINNGLDVLRQKYGVKEDYENTLKLVIESIEKLERRLALIELRIKEQELRFQEYMENIESRINDLELSIQEVNEPLVEPELVKTRRRQRI